MGLSLKCQYAVRALFELAKRYGDRVVRLQDIAEAQHIPGRYLENILSSLRQGGLVESRRGKEGGFRLARHPSEISIGDVVRYVEDTLNPVDCVVDRFCPLTGKCIFMSLWDEAKRAVEKVYDQKSLQNLVDEATALGAAECGAAVSPPAAPVK